MKRVIIAAFGAGIGIRDGVGTSRQRVRTWILGQHAIQPVESSRASQSTVRSGQAGPAITTAVRDENPTGLHDALLLLGGI